MDRLTYLIIYFLKHSSSFKVPIFTLLFFSLSEVNSTRSIRIYIHIITFAKMWLTYVLYTKANVESMFLAYSFGCPN